MSSGSAVQVEMAVTFGQFQQGLQQAARAMQDMVRSMGGELGKVPAAARPASEAIGGLAGTLRDFKADQVQQGRLVGFYVKELADVTGASESTRGAMAGLGGVLAEAALGGGAFAIGMEAAKAAIVLVREEWKRAEEQTLAVARAQDTANSAWSEGMQRFRSMNERLTAGQKSQRETMEALKSKLGEIDAEYVKLKEDGPGWIASMSLAFAKGNQFKSYTDWEKRVEAVGEAYRKAKQHIQDMGEVARAIGDRFDAAPAQDKQARDILAKDADSRERAKTAMAALNLQAAEYNHLGTVAVENARAKVELLRLELQLKKAVTAEERAAILAQMKAVEATRDENIRRAQIKGQFDDTAGLDESAGQDLSKSPSAMAAEENHKRFIKNLAEQKKAMIENTKLAMNLGEAIGQAFADMATGAKTAGEAMMAVLKSVLRAVIDSVKAQIMARAASTAAGAAESQSWIPGAGPYLAAAAMVAMLTMVQGLVDSVPSASGGFDIGNYNPLTQLHAGEMVLPKPLADRVRNMTDGGGGVTVNMNVTAFDAQGVRRTLLDNQGALAEAIAAAVRNRRIS